MRLALKRRILLAILATLAVWPLVHMWFVKRYDLDPWRFFGFAMYAVPATYQWVHEIELRDGREVNLHPSKLEPEPMRLHVSLMRQRAVLGDLIEPHKLAEALFAARPELSGVKVLMHRLAVSRETSRIEVRNAVAYVYKR
jgi:hypothetical protein